MYICHKQKSIDILGILMTYLIEAFKKFVFYFQLTDESLILYYYFITTFITT